MKKLPWRLIRNLKKLNINPCKSNFQNLEEIKVLTCFLEPVSITAIVKAVFLTFELSTKFNLTER